MKKSLRILILEDTPTDAELMQDELINSGIEFTSRRVESRQEFLCEIEAFEPDLILSDYMLPAFTGAEALELVKQNTPWIPVIIVTGSINEETAVECMKAGAADYVLKNKLYRLGPAFLSALEKKRLIQEKKQAEEQIQRELREKEVLLKEIHHRVKNNLNVIISLLNLQSLRLKEEEAIEAIKTSINRIYSIALVHTLLYQSDDFSHIDVKKYVQLLARQVHKTYALEDHVSLRLDIDDLTLSMDQVLPLGLILNELITNALQHAFPGRIKGTLRIALKEVDNKQLELTVQDDGVGFPVVTDAAKEESLGLHLVEILTEQLDGTLTSTKTKGAAFSIRFPAA